jgi:hypothetical protein
MKEFTNTSALTFRCLSSRLAPSLALKGIYFRNLKIQIFLLTNIRLRKECETIRFRTPVQGKQRTSEIEATPGQLYEFQSMWLPRF